MEKKTTNQKILYGQQAMQVETDKPNRRENTEHYLDTVSKAH